MARRHPGNPAKMPAGHAEEVAMLREFEQQCQLGLICWFCTSPAVATLVEPTLEPVFQGGAWGRELVRRPVCGPGYCEYGYGP